jgi:predicted PurR-regulated permease PerM
MAKAIVWLGLALVIAGVIVLAQPLLLIIGGTIFAVFLDGGVRLLGRYLPIPRGWRLLLTLILGFGFLGWVVWFAGTTIGAQFETLREVVTAQFSRLMHFVGSLGLLPENRPANIGTELLGSVGRLTSAVGSAIGAVTSVVAMIVIGIFLAAEPRIYDRGIAWMLPLRARSGFYRIAEHVGITLRRLLFGRLVGMIFEGFFTWFMLAYVSRMIGVGPVPMAALLGLVTGVLAFIPNIGAITSGVLMVAVGFSAGPHQGVYAIFVYFFVQNIDGYLVVPYIARRTVDLAPAVVLAMQLLMGALFGILGVLFADPILATLKVVLVDLSRRQAEREGEGPEVVPHSDGITAAAPAAAVPASAASSPRRRGRSSARAPRT